MNQLYLAGFDGLQAALAEEIRSFKRQDALAPVTVVVGSAAVASHLPRMLTQRLGGLGNVRVLSLHRLAGRLLEAGGRPAPRLLSPEAQARLVERVVSEVTSRAGSHFGPVATMPGLGRAFIRSLADLREANVPAAADWGPPRGGLADAQAALSAYESALQAAGCTDRAGMLAAAVSVLAECRPAVEAVLAPHSAVMVYGLYDLPQSQRALLGALAAVRPLSAFLPYPTEQAEYAEPGRRFFLDLGLTEVQLHASPPACTEALSVGDDEDEFLEVVRRLRALQAEGVCNHEVAVVAPTTDRAEEIARGLLALQVPVARRLPPAGGAVGRVLGLLDAVAPPSGRPWARSAVMDFAAALVQAGTGVAADVARWAEQSRQAGVVGGADRRRLADRRRYLVARLADLQAGEEDGEEPVSAGALQAAQRSLAAVDGLIRFVDSLVAGVEALPEQGSWLQMLAGFRAVATDLCAVAPDDPVLAALSELEDCALVEERVGLADAMRVLRERLRRLTQPHGAVGRRGVAVLTPHEVRGLRFRAVLFTGLCSGGFPPAAAHDPVLPDADRRELARRLAVPLAEVGSREREADVLFALARNAAADVFVGFVPRRDASGAQRQPSRLAVELAEQLTGRMATAEDFLHAPLTGAALRRVPSGALPVTATTGVAEFPAGRRPADLRDLDVALLAALHQDGAARSASGAPRHYLAEVCGERAARRLLGRRLAGVVPGVLSWDGVFHARAARRAIAAARLFAGPQAPTALQEYPRCPFSYYVLSVLGIEPVEEPEALVEADRREVGKVAHRVLQRVFAAVAEGADREQAIAMVGSVAEQECAAAERRGGVGLPLVWQAQRAQLVEDLALAVGSDACWSEADGRRPSLFELSFGADQTPVSVRLGDGTAMSFRGRIDRVDQSADGRRMRVIDYKTGRGSAEREQVEAGRNVQLPVYRLACRSLLGSLPDARIECAFRMVTRRRSQGEVALAADEAVVLADLADTVGVIRDLVEFGVFPRVPASERMCEWCRAGYACDELKSTRQAKRGHPALAELARLRRPVERAPAAAPAEDRTDA